MTIETCKRMLLAAKTPEEAALWQARIDHKIATFPKYAHLRVAVVEPELVKEVKNGKKSKR